MAAEERFAELFPRAAHGGLSKAEAAEWAKLCETIDYRAYVAENRRPVYDRARVLRTAPVFRVEFVDGEVADIPQDAGTLRPGDYFGAWYRFDAAGAVVSAEGVTLLSEGE